MQLRDKELSLHLIVFSWSDQEYIDSPILEIKLFSNSEEDRPITVNL